MDTLEKLSHRKLITVVGPTCVGKTRIINNLMKNYPIGGINLDSFMIFSFFRIGTGRSDINDSNRHLYGFADPLKRVSSEQYLKLVKKTLVDISLNKMIPLFEGGSVAYLNALLQNHELRIIGIFRKDKKSIKNAISRRIDEMLVAGLLEEVEIGLRLGYRETRVLNDDVIYLPIVDFIDKRITLERAKQRMIDNILRMIANQMAAYNALDIEWIEVNNASNYLSKVLEQKMNKLKLNKF